MYGYFHILFYFSFLEEWLILIYGLQATNEGNTMKIDFQSTKNCVKEHSWVEGR